MASGCSRSYKRKRFLVGGITWAKRLVVTWLLLVIILRFIAPPLTPLIIIRAIEYLYQGRPVIRGWKWRPLEYFPIHVQQSILAAEDSRFMQHWGVDLHALGDALEDADDSARPRGASTVTMQTVKNIFLWPGRSYVRKCIEFTIAPIAGVLWGKRRTLELYLNVIELGEGVYGLEAGSNFYFRKSAAELTVRDAAALAAILPAPRSLSPQALSPAAEKRYKRILRESRSIRVPPLRGRRVSGPHTESKR